MIPKIIWQTYKYPFNELPQYAKDAAQTWKDLNPDYKYIYMDDQDCRSFILHEYGEDWVEIFDSCPIGVMRSDIWRYLVLYVYGGVYADLDTICLKPIKEWVSNNHSATISEDDIPNTLFLVEPDGTINYNNIRSFSSADYAMLISFGQTLYSDTEKNFSFGTNAKVIHRSVGKFAKAWGVGLDAGLQYRSDKISFGLVVRDITTTYNAWRFSFTDKEKEMLYLSNNQIP
ncbi:MAG: hypothetical protein EBR55_04000, partial [Chitinophagia bacterium]|nr:hypothetical protein [Chitinophagia bacterium]